MISRIYRLVANRANFASPSLQSVLDSTPVEASAAAADVRSRMDLLTTTTDYAVCGAISSLLACPAMMIGQGYRLIGHPCVIGAAGSPRATFTPPSGITLVNSNTRIASVSRRVSTWPVVMTLRLTRLDDRHASCGFAGEVPQVIQARMHGDTLITSWTAASGLTGNLQFGQPSTWADNAQFDFTVEPSNYPARAVYEWVRTGSSWATLMQSAGLLSVADGARNLPIDHVAMLSMALALDTTARE